MGSAIRLIGALVALSSVCACGGSSSETPWPVEPDFSEIERAGEQRYVVVSGGKRKGAELVPELEEDVEAAPATWGEPPESEDPLPPLRRGTPRDAGLSPAGGDAAVSPARRERRDAGSP